MEGYTLQEVCDLFWANDENKKTLLDLLNTQGFQKIPKTMVRIDSLMNVPQYYCVAIEDFPPKLCSDRSFMGVTNIGWTLCKIGYTGASTQTSVGYNRVRQVEREIKNIDKDVRTKILFHVPKAAHDTRSNGEVEKSIRERMGKPLTNDCAMDLELPFHTEWVLAPNSLMNQAVHEIDTIKNKNGYFSTEIFDQYKLPDFGNLPPLPNYFQLTSDQRSVTCSYWC